MVSAANPIKERLIMIDFDVEMKPNKDRLRAAVQWLRETDIVPVRDEMYRDALHMCVQGALCYWAEQNGAPETNWRNLYMMPPAVRAWFGVEDFMGSYNGDDGDGIPAELIDDWGMNIIAANDIYGVTFPEQADAIARFYNL